ncbi:MAG: type secretion system protein GspF [Pseudomonadota bacterium]|jgi:general secretion pathway protein F
MPVFLYEAVDKTGVTSQGTVIADNQRAARADLRSRGLLTILLEARDSSKENTQLSSKIFFGLFKEKLSSAELSLFTRQLASLLEASLPLERALFALQEQAERPYVKNLVATIRSEVMGGTSLSNALAQHKADFNDIYRALVAAGEQIGQLAGVLVRLADHGEQRAALIQKLRLAFTYPVIVTVVALAIVIFLLTYVVPQIVAVFINSKQQLPLLTIVMLAISNFIRHWGWLLLFVLLSTTLIWRYLLKNRLFKIRWHTWLLTAPFYGAFERSVNTARFASTLSITTNSGVPILRALQISQDTLSNLAMREFVAQATSRVREGATLAHALASYKQFPPLLIHMIRAGEVTGELPAMLKRVASTQEQELERRAMTIASLLEPALILGMGVVVLLIVLAVLMPIIEINQLVR